MKIVGKWFVRCQRPTFFGLAAPVGVYDMGQITERVEDVIHDDYYAVEFVSDDEMHSSDGMKRVFPSSVISESFILFETFDQASAHMKWLREREEQRRAEAAPIPDEEIN